MAKDYASLSRLTDREWRIVSCVLKGKSNKEIGNELEITEGTVKKHLMSIFDKCGVNTRLQLAVHVANPIVHNIGGQL